MKENNTKLNKQEPDSPTTIHKLKREELETHIYIDEVDKVWSAYTNIPKDMRKFQKQGWEIVKTQPYPDGTVMSMSFKVARRSAISINKAEKRISNMTEEQKQARSEHMKKVSAKKNIKI